MSKEQKKQNHETEVEEILTVEQAADLLGIALCTLYKELWARRLPGVRFGRGRGTWRIPKQQLLEAVRARAAAHVVEEEVAGHE